MSPPTSFLCRRRSRALRAGLSAASAALLAPVVASAQHAAGRPGAFLAVGVESSVVPNALAEPRESRFGGGLSLGAGVRDRGGRFVRLDVRGVEHVPTEFLTRRRPRCDDSGLCRWTTRDYVAGDVRDGYGMATLRVGAEWTRWRPALRGAVGAGALLGGGFAPAGVASVGIAGGGRDARVALDAEAGVLRARVEEHTAVTSQTAPFGPAVAERQATLRPTPRWFALRLSVELPLGGGH